MKTKSLSLIALSVVASAIIYSCNFSNGSTLSEMLCLNYKNKTMNTMEVQLIRKMTDTYKAKQLNAINNNVATGFTASNSDARAIWFDLETLKAFIYHIEMEAKNQKTPVTSKDLGVHIYYASYPEYKSWGIYKDLPGTGKKALTSNYQGRHTLVMVPTIRREGIDFDFNPLDTDTYTTPLSSIEKYATGLSLPGSTPTRTYALRNSPSSETTGSQNHGSLIPPGNPNQIAF